jgi:hypothetical protein
MMLASRKLRGTACTRIGSDVGVRAGMGSMVNMSECMRSKEGEGQRWCNERLGVSSGMIMSAQKLRELEADV